MRKYRIRKTGEIIDVISYGGTVKERSECLDYVSYIDSKGEEHPNAKLNLYWDLEAVEPTDNKVRAEKRGNLLIVEGNDTNITLDLGALDKALELQKKYIELEGDIRRLCDWVMALKNNENPIICARFSNPYIKCICDAICDFRPLTKEERKQRDAEFKIAIDNLKQQSK